ncbi:MAG TPA: hypothetical protein VNO70_14050 [Blastocatellia bacterium]|nr:hypothetical protein [Blastocatellia bacterium]
MTRKTNALTIFTLMLSLTTLTSAVTADRASVLTPGTGQTPASDYFSLPVATEARTGPATSCAITSAPENSAGGDPLNLGEDGDCNKLPVKITKVEYKGRRNATDQVEVAWEADSPPCLRITEFKVTVEVSRDGGTIRSGSAKVDGQKRSTIVYVTAPDGDGPIRSYKSFITATASRTVTGGASKMGNL